MKKTLKHLLLAAVLVLMFGLFGCGSTLTTNLTMSDNYAGTRLMDVSISQSDFTEYVTNGDFLTIATETAAITPECLEFSYEETTDGYYNFHFVLPFTSKDDYMAKVTSLIGEGYTSEYTYSTAPFSEGVALEEDFSSEDLLQWFKDYLVEKGYVDSSDSSYIFEYTENYVTVNGIEYESWYDDLDIEEQSYVYIDELNIFTDIDAEKATIARKIEVVFSDYVKEDYSEKIETYLTSVTPEGCVAEWQSTDDGYEKYVLLIPACTPDEMTAAMQTFTASENSSVQLIIAGETIGTGKVTEDATTEESTDTEESTSQITEWENSVLGDISTDTVDSEKYEQPFGFDTTINEYLDLSTFICDSWGEVDSNYYISAKNGQPESRIYFEDGSDEYGWDYIDDEYPEYYYIEGEWEPVYQVVSEVNKYYVPSATELNTTVKSEEDVTREFVFKFDEAFDEAVAEKIETNLGNLFADKEDIISFDLSNKKKNTTITLTFEGTVTEVNKVCTEVFGQGYSSISYFCQDKFALKQYYDFAETIDLGKIFDWEYDGNIDYTAKMPGKVDEYATYISGGNSSNTDISGKKVNYLSTNSGYVYSSIAGAKTNPVVVILILAIILVVVGGIAVAVVLIIKNSKKKPNPQVQAPYGQPYAQPMGQPMATPVQPVPQPQATPVQPAPQAQAPVQPAPEMQPQAAGIKPVVDLTPVQSAPVEEAPAQPVEPQVQAPVQPEVQATPVEPQQPAGKFCANCGTALPEGGAFCPNCGAKLQ